MCNPSTSLIKTLQEDLRHYALVVGSLRAIVEILLDSASPDREWEEYYSTRKEVVDRMQKRYDELMKVHDNRN